MITMGAGRTVVRNGHRYDDTHSEILEWAVFEKLGISYERNRLCRLKFVSTAIITAAHAPDLTASIVLPAGKCAGPFRQGPGTT